MKHSGLFKAAGLAGALTLAGAAGLSAGQPAKAIPGVQQPQAEAKVDRLYTVLSENAQDLDDGLGGLFADTEWKPSSIDVAKVFEALPTLNAGRQTMVVMLLTRHPQKCVRWVDVLVDQIVRDNPTDNSHMFYMHLHLIERIARADPDGRTHSCLKRLWTAADLRATQAWAQMTSELNIGDWRTEFREWKTRLSEADLEKSKEIILQIEAQEAKAKPKD